MKSLVFKKTCPRFRRLLLVDERVSELDGEKSVIAASEPTASS
jgi:hypothetical protein